MAEFERNLVRRLGGQLSRPTTEVTGLTTKPFYVDSADPYKRGNRGVAELHQVVRRPPTRCRGRQAQPRRGERAVPHQRRRGAVRTDVGVAGRHRRTTRRPTPPDARRGDRHRPATRSRSGSRARPAQRARSRTTRSPRAVAACSSWPRGLHRRLAAAGTRAAPRRHRSLGRQRQPADVYDIDAAGRIAPDALRRAQPLRRGHLGDRRRSRHPHRRPRRRQRRRLALDELLKFRSYLNRSAR